MRGAEEYLDAAQLSLQEGFPMSGQDHRQGLRVRRSGHRAEADVTSA